MNFSDLYKNNRRTISLEFFPPRKEEGLPETLELIADLARLKPDFMTCTYGAGGGTRGRTRQIVSYMHNELKMIAVAHLTCVGHSQDEIDQILKQLSAEGIRHLLALRGDPPKGITHFEAHPNGFSNARDLVRHIVGQNGFSVAVAGYPEVHRDAKSAEEEIKYLKEKVDAGGEIVITQLFFDPEYYFNFVNLAYKTGITVPIVPGIMPISSYNQIEKFINTFNVGIPRRMREKLEELRDRPAELLSFGTDYALEQSAALLRGGAPGIHLYTLNKSTQAHPILEELKRMV